MGNDKTQWIFDENTGDSVPGSDGAMTESIAPRGPSDSTRIGNDEPTALVGGGAGTSEKTMIYRAGEESGLSEGVDPVTGWLVVVKGPGLGNAVQLGAGMNAVGRGSDARASLPFGDRLISSNDHVRIIYDDAERAFFIAHGSGTNVSRVNGQLLANTMPLEPDATIELSRATTVVFKAFCSKDFDWSDAMGDGAG